MYVQNHHVNVLFNINNGLFKLKNMDQIVNKLKNSYEISL
jgi:hypothetical protein